MSVTKQKALTERLFLIDIKENSKVDLEREFHVMGSTGNVYKVEIKKILLVNALISCFVKTSANIYILYT